MITLTYENLFTYEALYKAGAQSATGGTGNRRGKLSGKYSIIYRGKPLVNEKPLYYYRAPNKKERQ